MTYHSPALLPKVRSKALMDAIGGKTGAPYPCTLRIASFIPGHRCSAAATVVGAHIGTPGKGMSTKSSDLAVVAACKHCHDLLDRVDRRWTFLEEAHKADVQYRITAALIETHSLLLRDGIITVKGGDVI